MDSKKLWDLACKCQSIATAAHTGQKDKAGAPYIQHPKRVALAVWNWIAPDPDYITNEDFAFAKRCECVAWLHDVLEDTGETVESLKAKGIPDDIIDGVVSVTRKEGESYGDFVKRASEDMYGLRVKYFDIMDNLDLTRLKSISADDVPRINKYLKWEKFLKAKLADACIVDVTDL